MEPPKIVITPLFNSEDELGVLVTRSFSSLASMQENQFDLLYGARVNGAKAIIEHNGMRHELLSFSPIYLSGEITFSPYSEYTLTVTDTLNGETVKATTMMLPQVNLDTLMLTVSRQYNDTALNLKIRIHDDGIVKKYYLTTFKLNQEITKDKSSKSSIKKSLYDQIEIFDNSSTKDGKLVYEKTFRQNQVEFGSRDSVIVEVSEVSKAYYDYLTIYKKTGSFLNQLTGEPINFPTNVKGGAGFFFLVYPVYKDFILGEL
jgi:hypothetical protein